MADKTVTNEVAPQRPISEVHADLEKERDAQAAFNAEQHRIQVEQANKFNNLANTAVVQAPDDARSEALATQKAIADSSNADATSAAKTTAPKSTTKPTTQN